MSPRLLIFIMFVVALVGGEERAIRPTLFLLIDGNFK